MPPQTAFIVSKNMVERFSRLTGDRNPLHVDPQFARRTHYRQRIAHGMLVFGFASLLIATDEKSRTFVPTRMSAQFLEPIPVGSRLVLCAEGHSDNGSETWSVQAVGNPAETVVFKGILEGQRRNVRGPAPPDVHKTATSCAMVSNALEARLLSIDDIQKGHTENFEFQLTPSIVDEYLSILKDGFSSPLASSMAPQKSRFYFPNLAASMMLSTSVGMFCPGQLATFLGFDIDMPHALPIRETYRFHGSVRHVSRATGMIKKEVRISPSEAEASDPVVQGHVHAAVNLPPTAMPELQELVSHQDLGIMDQVALITGASRGIGETIAKMLALHGARIVVNYHRGRQDAKRVVEEIKAHGSQALAIQCDVRDAQQVAAMVAETVSTFGAIHILVNNAVSGFKPIAFRRLTWDDIQGDIDVAVKGAFHCCHAALPLMADQHFGKIVNIGTVATDNPPMQQAKYVIAKSALVGLTRAMSIEYAARNIQVNMVVPNFVETDLVAHIAAPYRKKIASDTPMQRTASPVDVAQAVVYLASRYSNYMTGQKIMVTGGGAPYT